MIIQLIQLSLKWFLLRYLNFTKTTLNILQIMIIILYKEYIKRYDNPRGDLNEKDVVFGAGFNN